MAYNNQGYAYHVAQTGYGSIQLRLTVSWNECTNTNNTQNHTDTAGITFGHNI